MKMIFNAISCLLLVIFQLSCTSSVNEQNMYKNIQALNKQSNGFDSNKLEILEIGAS